MTSIQKSTTPTPAAACDELRRLHRLIENDAAIRAQREAEFAQALAAAGSPDATADDLAAMPANVAVAHAALTTADAALAAYRRRARVLMPTVHQEAERHAAEAKQMLKSAFDLAVAGTRKKVAALVKDGLFAPASTDEILARSIPVQQAAAQFQAHQMGRLSMVFGPGGVPELSPDVSIAELLHYADRAAEVLAAAKAQLAAVKATR